MPSSTEQHSSSEAGKAGQTHSDEEITALIPEWLLVRDPPSPVLFDDIRKNLAGAPLEMLAARIRRKGQHGIRSVGILVSLAKDAGKAWKAAQKREQERQKETECDAAATIEWITKEQFAILEDPKSSEEDKESARRILADIMPEHGKPPESERGKEHRAKASPKNK